MNNNAVGASSPARETKTSFAFGSRATRRGDGILVVAYYGNDDHEFSEISKSSSYAFQTKGAKFQNLKKLVVQNPHFSTNIRTSGFVTTTFGCRRHKSMKLSQSLNSIDFWIAQPAFSP